MDVRVLGRLEVFGDDGAPIDLGSPLQRSLLALLLLQPRAVRSDDWLVEHLWCDVPPPGSPVASLQTYVARARRTLRRRDGTALLSRSGGGYRLDVTDDEVDANRFIALAGRARDELRAGRPAESLPLAEAALGLWRAADPLPELADREVARVPRDRWRELRVGCQEDGLEALLLLGRPEDAVADLDALTAAEPLRERGWLLLLRALQATGRIPDALERYRRVRAHLNDDLGLEPGPALRELHAALLREEAPRVATSTTAPSPVPSGPVSTTPSALVGREGPCSTLVELVSNLRSSGPRFVLVEGEPGIGKTRLVEEITRVAQGLGLRTAWGRCHEDASVGALWPWRQVVSSLAPADAGLLGDDLSRVFEKVRDVIVRASAASPAVVVLDDLHWADAPSLRLLSFLTRELDRAPVAFLVTTRPGELSEHHVRTRADLARTTGYRHLDLGPLDDAATAELVGSAAATLADGELGRVCRRSGGNPLFALELARLVEGRGDGSALPAGVRDVIRRRLAPLPPEAHGILALCAVVGDTCDLELVLRAAGPDLATAAAALEPPLRTGLLRATGDVVEFSHALVREALLADLTDLEQRRLHARIAQTDPVDLFERAHHLLEGRPFTDVAATERACREAAERAERERTYESAAQWWQRALEVGTASPGAGPAPQRVLLALATDLVRSGQAIAGQERLRECLEVSLTAGDTATAVDAARVLAGSQGSWYWVEYGTYPTELLALLRRTLAALPPDDEAARVRVLLTTAAGEQYGDTVAAKVLARDAVAAARRLGDPALLAQALGGWLYCTWSTGDEEEIDAAATELLALAETLPDALELTLLARLRRSQVRLVLADTAGSDADVAAAWDLATELRLPLYQAEVIQLQGARALLAGEFDLAEELYERARLLHERVQMHAAQLTDLASLLLLRRERGLASELLPLLEGVERTPGNGVDVIVVAAMLQGGDVTGAREVCRRYGTLSPAPRWWNWEAWTCFQADLAASLGDLEAARRVVEDLIPVAGHIALYGAVGALGPVTRFLGRAEAALGRWAEAEAHLRSCLALTESLGLRPSWVAAAVTLAEVLLATDRATEAAELLAEAERTAVDVGMPHELHRAAALRARFDGVPVDSRTPAS